MSKNDMGVALVTGTSSGIGEATAQRLQEPGMMFPSTSGETDE